MTRQKEGKKTVRIFALSSFLNDFGSDMIYPIWPLFVTSVLNANMAILGLIDGIGDAIVALSQAASGYLSDKWGKRKIFIWTGYLFGGLSRLGYAASTIWQHLIPFRILDRAGKMRGAPRDAMIADVSTKADRGRNFGLLRTFDNLGAVFGIIACILLVNYIGYKELLMIAAVPSFIAVALVFFFVKERKTERMFKGFSLKSANANFKLFLASSALFSLGFFSYSFLLIFAKDAGFQPTLIPVLYLIFTLAASIMSLQFGKLADRLKRKTIMMLSYAFFFLMCLGFVFIKSPFGIELLFVLYGLHLAARLPVQSAFVSELAPKQYRASALGAFQMVTGLCALPASVIAGLLWESFGRLSPFYFSLGLTLLATVLLLFVREE